MHILILPSEQFVVKRNPLAGIFQYEQAKALAKTNNQVGIISVGFLGIKDIFTRNLFNAFETEKNINIMRKYKKSLLLWRFLSSKKASMKHINLFKSLYFQYETKYGRPDVVHAHNFLYAGVLAKFLYDTYSIPYVVTEHSSAFARGLIPLSYDMLIKEICSKAAVLSCVSTPFKNMLQKRLNHSFEVLPNILEPTFLEKPIPLQKKKDFIFITVGSLDENKNQKLLLKAFAKYFKYNSFKLIIVGDGPLRINLEQITHDLDINKQVIFLGQLSRSEVGATMREANCFVLPSNYETFGVVLIEALASGLPLIATRSGGPEDIVNTSNGLLIEVGNESQLGEAMQKIFTDQKRFDKNLLRAEARIKYGEDAFSKNIMTLYSKAI